MPHEGSSELSKIRLENASLLLNSSRMLIEIGDYKSAANRAYYAMFAAMRSCLALLGRDNKKHSGVISDFRLHFIKTGKLRTELSDIVSELFEVRTLSDYNDFYIISKSEVLKQLENAEMFFCEVKEYINIAFNRQLEKED